MHSSAVTNLLNELSQDNILVRGFIRPHHLNAISKEALLFVAELSRNFDSQRRALLQRRKRIQQQIDSGSYKPTFLKETKHIREDPSWSGPSIPSDLQDRRVEITGPVSRKMVINALNSDAKVFMADFEDANSPTFSNQLDGQVNLKDAVDGTISYRSGEKYYKLKKKHATLMVRPRGLHLEEEHFLVDGLPVGGSLFDFGIFFYNNAKKLIEKGSGPYFYLPKLESHFEARWWSQVFKFSEKKLGFKKPVIRATVLIETILAAFEMEEIIYELRDYSAGLNCGRWDYIFSFIKKFFQHKEYVLGDRATVTMTEHFMNSYVQLLIKICHKRGVHAMGGMAAQIPIKNDKQANELALEKVRSDKEREVKAGHDGTWVAHPGLIPTAMDVFNKYMPTKNQISKQRDDVHVTEKDLLKVPEKVVVTEKGLRDNIRVCLLYLTSWLSGIGCIPINNLMEDLATAEISRSQVQQWMKHKVVMSNGKTVTHDLVMKVLDEEVEKIEPTVSNTMALSLARAVEIFVEIIEAPYFVEFMSLPAYRYLISVPRAKL